MKLTRIVLTGGPGGGKTEALSEMRKRYEEKGYHVIVTPETATEVILAGLGRPSSMDNFDFQTLVLKLLLYREDEFTKAASLLQDGKDVLMICDRGALDGFGFLEPPLFEKILKNANLTKEDLYDRYDAVFQLETAAKSTLDSYTLSNNAARTENKDEAAVEDDVLYETWCDHPHYFFIGASETIEEKMDLLEKAIDFYLDNQKEAKDHAGTESAKTESN